MNTTIPSKTAVLGTLLVSLAVGVLVATKQELLLWEIAIAIAFVLLFFLYYQFFPRWDTLLPPRFSQVILFLALFSGPPRFRSRDPMASLRGEIDLVILVHVAIWMLGAAWVTYWILLDLSHHRSFRLHRIENLALLFAISLALSILVSPAPYLTGFRVFQIFIMIFLSHYWTRRFGIDVTLRSLLLGFTLMGGTILASLFFKPDLVLVSYGSASFRLRGDYIANAGTVGLLGLSLLIAYPMNKPRVLHITFILGFSAILLASRTRSAYIGFFIFLLLVLFRSPHLRGLKVMRALILLSIPAVAFFHENAFRFLVREQQSIYTLSGRLNAWALLISYTLAHSPLIGLGFYTERVVLMPLRASEGYSGPAGTAHGSFAAVFAGAGILGLATFIALVVYLFVVSARLYFDNVREPAVFSVITLLLVLQPIGFVSEELVVASPASLTFFMTISLLARLWELYQS